MPGIIYKDRVYDVPDFDQAVITLKMCGLSDECETGGAYEGILGIRRSSWDELVAFGGHVEDGDDEFDWILVTWASDDGIAEIEKEIFEILFTRREQ